MQINGWHLYLGDADLASVLAIGAVPGADQPAGIAARRAVEAVKVNVAGGASQLPLSRLLPPAQLGPPRRFLSRIAVIRFPSTPRFGVLIIEVTNARDVVRQRIGRLGERLIGRVVDPEAQVEKAIVQGWRLPSKEFGIEARIVSVEGPQLIGRQRLELPIRCATSATSTSASPEPSQQNSANLLQSGTDKTLPSPSEHEHANGSGTAHLHHAANQISRPGHGDREKPADNPGQQSCNG